MKIALLEERFHVGCEASVSIIISQIHELKTNSSIEIFQKSLKLSTFTFADCINYRDAYSRYFCPATMSYLFIKNSVLFSPTN